MPKPETVEELKDLHTFVPKPLYEAIQAEAAKHDRTVTAEIRRTLKRVYGNGQGKPR